MRVLLHYFAKLGGLGGIEKTVLDLAIGLRQHGCETGIIEMATQAGPKNFIEGNIPVWTVSKPSDFRWQRPRSWLSRARSVWQFRCVEQEFRPDIVHVHFPSSQIGILNWLAPLPRRWRLVATAQNSEIRCLPKSDQRAMAECCRFYDLVVSFTAVNQELLEEATSYFPSLRSKRHLILNGVAPEWFDETSHSLPKEDSALFVGRLEHIKGVDLLLEAWQKVHAMVPWKRLLLAGDGTEAASYRNRVAELGIAENVVFLGRKSHFELRQLYRDAGVVLLPSRKEGLPLSLLEAGACGAICIASDIAGNRDIVRDHVTGFLAEPESVDSLANAMLVAGRLTVEERRVMKATARDLIRERFSSKEVLETYVHLFQSLI